MSAALKSSEVYPQPSSTSTASRSQRRLRVIQPPPQSAATIAFPKSPRSDRPLWLKLLIAGQRLSLGLAVLTVTGALSAYALTVDSNRRLTAATATLGQLQDHQQQLTTANAVFKNHLAQTAITAVENGTLHPKDVIFLEAVDPVATPKKTPPSKSKVFPPDQRFFPKGY